MDTSNSFKKYSTSPKKVEYTESGEAGNLQVCDRYVWSVYIRNPTQFFETEDQANRRLGKWQNGNNADDWHGFASLSEFHPHKIILYHTLF